MKETECLKVILSRRSVRHFSSEQVSEEMVESLLRAAMAAPSAGDQQPWHFVVINDRVLLDAIPGFHGHSKMLLEAPLAILVCTDPTQGRYPEFSHQDSSAAVQNILLAAHSFGLGAVWLGVYPKEDYIKGMRNLANIPAHVVPHALIAVGHPTRTPSPADRFDRARVHYNQW